MPGGRTLAAAAGVAMLCDTLPWQPGAAWLTAPQRDERRQRSSGASASITADGRYVAFASYARLTAADVDSLADVYVLDRSTASVTLESATVEGKPLQSDCSGPAISADGRYLVFEAVVMNDDPARTVLDVVFRDRVVNTSRRITMGPGGVPSNGWSGQALVVADGSAVVFTSAATNLTAARDLNERQPDIYRFEVRTGVIERLSLDSHGVQLTGGSVMPSASADGRYVAFSSTAVLASARRGAKEQPDQGQRSTIYLRDTQKGQTALVGGASDPPNDASMMPAVSADGRFVAFASRASNLVPRDRNKSFDVFLYEVATAAVTLVSRGRAGGAANGASLGPAISADGRLIAFQSDASDMACAQNCPRGMEDINLLPDVFLFNRTTGQISCLSLDRQGAWLEESGGAAIDGTGTVVAFTSRHPISTRDVSNDFDLFVGVVPE